MKIAVGSRSKLKESANVKAFQQVGLAAFLLLTDAPSWIPEEPLNPRETEIGAHNRADQALKDHPEAELGIGVENGIRVKAPAPGEHVLEPAYEDWAVVVIKDRHGCVVVTHSRAVAVPLEYVLASLAKRREVTVGKITTEHHPEVIHDNPHPFWSNGEFDREQLLIEAIVDGLCQFFNLPHPNSKKESTMTERTYTATINGQPHILNIRAVSEKTSVAVLKLRGKVQLTRELAKALAALIKERGEGVDVLLTPEGKAEPLVFAVAEETSLPYVVATKKVSVTLEEPIISSTGSSITTAGTQKYYLGAEEVATLKGKRVLAIDDAVSTGGSLAALIGLLVQIEDAAYCGCVTVVTEGDANKRHDVTALGHLPLFSNNV